MKKLSKKAYEKYDLRRGVDFIGVNVIFFCHDGKGKVLLHKRSKNCRDEQGRWDCGGGSMEFGESFEEAVTREVMEEYGVKPLEIRYVKSVNILRDNNGTPTHWVGNFHIVRVDPKKVTNNDPKYIDEVGWFSLKKLPSPLHSKFLENIPFVEKVIQQRR